MASWRQKAAAKMEAMKQRATEQMEVMQEKTTLAVASAREQYDIKQTKKMSADEDRYAKAWREHCVGALGAPDTARDRLADFAANGTLEADNPMVARALATLAAAHGQQGTFFAGRKAAGGTMCDTACTFGSGQEEMLLGFEAQICRGRIHDGKVYNDDGRVGRWPSRHTRDAATAAVDGVLDGLRRLKMDSWATAVRAAVAEGAALGADEHAAAAEDQRKHLDEQRLRLRDGVRGFLRGGDGSNPYLQLQPGDARAEQEAVEQAQQGAELAALQHAHDVGRARWVKTLAAADAQACGAATAALCDYVEAQAEFFAQAHASMQAMLPSVVVLRAKAGRHVEAAASLHGQLAQAEEAVVASTPEFGVPWGASPPVANRLEDGSAVDGRRLGPPQRQGYLYRGKSRRWCVLLNGRLYEYADTWSGAPLDCTPMFLCNAKAVSGAVRLGIELRQAQGEPVLYQCLTEADRTGWLGAIQDATAYMITHQPADADDGADSPRGAAGATRQAQLALSNMDGNEVCADCGAAKPNWVSTALGCLVCVECSGAHRGLQIATAGCGSFGSRVRSLQLDDFSEPTVALLNQLGNAFCATLWEATEPAAAAQPSEAAAEPDAGVEAEIDREVGPGSEAETEAEPAATLEAVPKPVGQTDRRARAAYVAAKYHSRQRLLPAAAAAHTYSSLTAAAAANDARGAMLFLIIGPCSEVDEALLAAVGGCSLATAELLLNCGASCTAVGSDGVTVLHHAVATSNPVLVQLVLGRGAGLSVNTADGTGCNPHQLGQQLASTEGMSDPDPAAVACLALLDAAAEREGERLGEQTDAQAGRTFEAAQAALATGAVGDAVAIPPRDSDPQKLLPGPKKY
jgi:hypothetical protein